MNNHKKLLTIAISIGLLTSISLSACDSFPLLEESDKSNVEVTESTKKVTEKTSETKKSETSITELPDQEPTFNVPQEATPYVMQEGLGHKYDMDIELDTDAQVVRGTVRVDIVNQTDVEWSTLVFRDYPSLFSKTELVDYSDFVAEQDREILTQISYFEDESGEILAYERDSVDYSVITVTLKDPIAPGQRHIIEYEFEASIPTLADRYGAYEGCYNISNFYPVLSIYENGEWSRESYIDMGECFYTIVSDYTVRIKTPADFTLASTGLTLDVEEKPDGKYWNISAPCARDFTFVAGADFNMLSEELDGVMIEAYYIGDDMEFGRAMLEAGIDSMKAFGEAFGKYPYPDVNIIETELFAGGMEYSGLVMIGRDLEFYSTDYSVVKEVTAHELGHQWFYGIVGTNPYLEPWLDESFASFSEIVYADVIGDDYMSSEFDSYRPDSYFGREYTPVNRSYDQFGSEMVYFSSAYTTGEAMLYYLRDAMGAENFYHMMRTYVSRHAFGIVTEADFLNVVYEYCGTDNNEVNAVLEFYLD